MSSEGAYTAGTQVLFINNNEARDQGQVQAYQGQFENAENEEGDASAYPLGNNRKSHKQAEKARRDRMNQRLDFLRKIVPDAQSLTKVKLLDVTIEYIALLKERLGLRSPVDDNILQLLSDDKVRYIEGRQAGDSQTNEGPPSQPIALNAYATSHVPPARASPPASAPSQLVYVNDAQGQQYTINSAGQTVMVPPMSDAPVDANFQAVSGVTQAPGGTSSPIQLIVQLPPNTDIKTLLDQHGGNLGITLNGKETIITAGPGGVPEADGGPGGEQAVALAGGQQLQSLPIAQMINVSGAMMAMEVADGAAGSGDVLGGDAGREDPPNAKRVKLEDGTTVSGPGTDTPPPPEGMPFDHSIPTGSAAVAPGQLPQTTSTDHVAVPHTFLPHTTIVGHDPNAPGGDGAQAVGQEFPTLPAAAQVIFGPQGQVSISLPDHLSEEERKQIAMQVLQQYSAYSHPVTGGPLPHGPDVPEGGHVDGSVAHVAATGEEAVEGPALMAPTLGEGLQVQQAEGGVVEGVDAVAGGDQTITQVAAE